MKKGIVMEINDGYLTLLTPDGEFLRARKQNQPYAIGEEIVFFPSRLPEKKQSIPFLKRMLSLKSLAAVAIALIIFFGSFLSVSQNNKAYAYVSIDVNPSIELVLNKKMQVLKVTAFNQDGKKIVARIGDWKKKKIADLTQLLLSEMKKQGYLNEHHLVVISTVRTDKKEENAEKILSENLKEIKTIIKENHLELSVLNGTPKELEKAHQLGITTGKYKESQQQSKEKKQPSSHGEMNGVKEESPKAEKNETATPKAASVPSTPAKQPKEATRGKKVTPPASQASPAAITSGGSKEQGKKEDSANYPQPPVFRAPGQVKKIEEPVEKAKDVVKEKLDKEIKHEFENNSQNEIKAEEQEKKHFNSQLRNS
ncbi:anti-sigma-I factor RsgI family protein [Neobacillus sp. SM06]|uniref:anti-sigma factor domain-containing protein n=1 Tax=Neobacillus sp. SM06 TaxID=3422492 RepID=UPI003D2E1C28